MKFKILFFFTCLYLTSFAQISWENYTTISTTFSKYIRTCKIERGLGAGDILLTYSDRDHGGNIWLIRSSDLGLSWTDPDLLIKSPKISDGEYVFNANMIQLADDRLMLVYQHRWDPGTIATKSYVGIRYSSDGGYTWTEEQVTPTICMWEPRAIQVHNDVDGDGNNDIYVYFTQEVTPTFFAPELCTQQNSVGRAIAYIVSYDNGVTWKTNSDERFSGRIVHRNYDGQKDSQGGMPTMIELPNHRIAVVAEAPKGSSYAFASWVIASDPYDYDFNNIQGAWSSVDYKVGIQNAVYDGDGYVTPSSVTLSYDFKVYPDNSNNLWKMSTVYGNAPFTCIMPNGLVAYSQNSSQKIRVFVANANGKNSVAVANPFGNSASFYSSIIPISDDMVLCTAHDPDTNGNIYLCRGTIVKDNSAPTIPGIPVLTSKNNDLYTFSWTASNDNIIVSNYEVWNNDQLLVTTRWDNSVQINLQPETNYQLKVRAKDYQGNYSGFSNTLSFVTKVNETAFDELQVYPTLVEKYIQIKQPVKTNDTQLYLVSMLGKIIPLSINSGMKVDLSTIQTGCYQLILIDGDQQFRTRIIKK